MTLQEAITTADKISPNSRKRLKLLNINSPDYPKQAAKLSLQIAKETGLESFTFQEIHSLTKRCN